MRMSRPVKLGGRSKACHALTQTVVLVSVPFSVIGSTTTRVMSRGWMGIGSSLCRA